MFFVVAFALRRAGVGDEVTLRVAGGMAYGFIAFAALVLLTSRRRGVARARRCAIDAVRRDPEVIARVGTPVAGRIDALGPAPEHDAPWNVPVTLTGPLGSAVADVALVRHGGDWRVAATALSGRTA